MSFLHDALDDIAGRFEDDLEFRIRTALPPTEASTYLERDPLGTRVDTIHVITTLGAVR